MDGVWRTINYEDVKEALKNAKVKTSQKTRKELSRLMKKNVQRDEMLSTDSESDGTVVEVSDDEADGDDGDDDDRDENKNMETCSLSKLSIISANARSLLPKLESLSDHLHESSVHFALVTETWLQDGKNLEELAADLENGYSLAMICRNRTAAAANGRQYGGIAFIYRLSAGKFNNFAFNNPDNHEVLAMVGRVYGIRSKIFCLTCYAAPNIGLLKARGLVQLVSDLVAEAKRLFEDCLVIVGGNFNQWPIDDFLEEHPDMGEVDHGPTKNDRRIDRTFVNFCRSVVESGTTDPLETEEGSQSDHKVAYLEAEFRKEEDKVAKYSYRKYTDEGADNFADKLGEMNWNLVFNAGTTTEKADALQTVLDGLMDECFEIKTTVRKENDLPWIDDRLRGLWRKRRKLFDGEARSPRWKALKRKSDYRYRTRMNRYLNNLRKNLTAGDASRIFFRLVNALKAREKPPAFDVHNLFPSLSDKQIAEKLAEHFNKISSEFKGLSPDDIPLAPSRGLPLLARAEVAKRLREIKKPKSMVKGDIFHTLLARTANCLSAPLTHIYNKITRTGEWPSGWKMEYVTPIPKKTAPETENDLRNISCTMMISKIYESFVLAWLTQQVGLRHNQ